MQEEDGILRSGGLWSLSAPFLLLMNSSSFRRTIASGITLVRWSCWSDCGAAGRAAAFMRAAAIASSGGA